ncbi:polysaccharide deacetylase family protein [Solicola sp. PLA-1-18]|uniref:polysaccharide deacetylase family protein n=1 Tax=Solicola sp. PLA-1-18 TaxID=3380532 RepID=UPI003B7953B1
MSPQDTYPWPGDTTAGLCVTVDFDGESPHLWRTRAEPPRGVAELEQRRYGPHRGVWNVLAAFARLGLRATFYVPGWIARTYPDAVRAIHDDGHEIALHGWLHEPPTDLTTAELRDTLERAASELEGLTGRAPTGYRSPSWQMTPETFDVLRSLGLEYDSSLMGEDRPYLVEGLVEVPVDWATDDAPYYRYAAGDPRPPAFPHALVAAWRDEIAAAERHGSLCMLTIHPFLSGRPARLSPLEDLLAEVLDHPGLHVDTVARLASHHRDVSAGHPSRSLDRPEVRS